MAATPSGKTKLVRSARLYVNGYDLSGDARSVGVLKNQFGEIEATGWSDGVVNYLSDFKNQVGIEGLQVMMNDATGRSFERLKDSGQSLIVTFAFGSALSASPPDIPDPCYMLGGVQMSSDSSFDGGLAVMSAEVKSSAAYENTNPNGVILAADTYTNAQNLDSHDNEAATTSGWHANLHVLDAAGSGMTVILESGADDAAFSTLHTFTADGSAITAEHASGTGSVGQYVRLRLTGTGSINMVVGFARAYQ